MFRKIMTASTAAAGKVRRATLFELKAILDINDNFFEGLDYFPGTFYVYMHSKQRAIYVYESNGKVLGVLNFKFHSQEENLVTAMSGRVHSSLQGQGLIAGSDSPIMKHLAKEYPNITGYVGTTLLKPNIQTKLHRQYKPLFTWNCVYFKPPDRQWLKSFAGANQPLKPIRLSHDDAVEWIQSDNKQLETFLESYSKDFVPALISFEPIRINGEGLRYLFSNSYSFVSFGDRYGTNSDQIRSTTIAIPEVEDQFRPASEAAASFITKAQEYGLAGLSYSSCVPVKYGLRVDIYFFGDSEDIFLSHIRCHTGHYLGLTTDQVKIGVVLNFPLTISLENVESRLREEWGEKLATGFFAATHDILYISNFAFKL